MSADPFNLGRLRPSAALTSASPVASIGPTGSTRHHRMRVSVSAYSCSGTEAGPDVRAQGLLTGPGRIPTTVRLVLQLDVGTSFPPEPEERSLVGIYNDAGVRAVDEVASINGLNPDRR